MTFFTVRHSPTSRDRPAKLSQFVIPALVARLGAKQRAFGAAIGG